VVEASGTSFLQNSCETPLQLTVPDPDGLILYTTDTSAHSFTEITAIVQLTSGLSALDDHPPPHLLALSPLIPQNILIYVLVSER
jgi:hypothetical protein